MVLTTCKKKTDIEVTIFSYALNEPVANAKIALVQRKLNAFGGTYTCEQIDNKTTDADGKCSFNREKLKTNSNYQYYLAITEAYGKTQEYSCASQTSNFLKVGSTNSLKYDVGTIAAFVKVQLNNLMNPSNVGDSLIVSVANPKYQLPGAPFPVGGNGILMAGGWNTGSSNYPNIIVTNSEKTNAGKNTVHIRKRKMGVVTTRVDTVKIYPYETKIIEINW